jgi:DNA replication and repair protein RecF
VVIGGKPQKSSGSLGQYMRLLWLTPAMDRLFAGSASDRRRFLDRLVQAFDPEHGSRISVFEKVMRERNLLLEENHSDGTWLSSLEAHMAEAGVAIAAARISALEALRRHIGEARELSPFPWSKIDVEGEIEGLLGTMPAVRAEDKYRMILGESRGLDRAAGRTLRGPHRSDFQVVHGPKDMPAGNSSTGEQKALLIGLILAHADLVSQHRGGAAPLLLLDEITAHLDPARRLALFAEITRLGCQAWLTGTDAHAFAGLVQRAQFFDVLEGRVSAGL